MDPMDVDLSWSEDDEIALVPNDSNQQRISSTTPVTAAQRKNQTMASSSSSHVQPSFQRQHSLPNSHPHEPAVPQWESISTMTVSSRAPGVKKPRAKPPTDRTPGHTLIPMSRLDSIVHSDPDNGVLSKEALFTVAVATEEFLKKISKAAHTRADVDRRSLVQYRDVAATAFHFEEFQFLQDSIPQPMSLSKALALREAKLKQQPDVLAEATPSASKAESGAAESEVQTKAKGKRKAKEMDVDGDMVAVSSTSEDKKKRHSTKKASAEPKLNGASSMPPPPPPPPRPDRPVRERKPRTPSAAGFTPLTERDRESVERPTPDISESVSLGPGGGQQEGRVASVGPNRIRIRGPRMSGSPYPSPHPPGNTEASGSGSASQGQGEISQAQTARKASKRVSAKAALGVNGEVSSSARMTNGSADGVTFAPVGATEPPLWSRKPLPPYGSGHATPSDASTDKSASKRRSSKAGNDVRLPVEGGMDELWPHGSTQSEGTAARRPSMSISTVAANMPDRGQGHSPSLSPSTPTHQHQQAGAYASPGHSPVQAHHHHHVQHAHPHTHSHTHASNHTHDSTTAKQQHHGHYPAHVHNQTRQPQSGSGSSVAGNHDSRYPESGANAHPLCAEGGLSLDFRSALSPTAPNPGRTIYSQMR